MDINTLVDCMIKLVEHLGPCAALLLILHTQNASSLRQLLARLEQLQGELTPKV